MHQTGRTIAAAGFAYPVLTIAAFLAFPTPPGGDVSAVADPAWLADHVTGVVAQCLVRSLGALGFLALAVAVTGWTARLTGRAAVAAGTVCATLLLLAQGFVLAAATAVRTGVDDRVAEVSAALNAATLDLSSLPAVALFATAAYTFLTRDGAPRWLGILSALGVPLGLVDATSFPGGPFASFGLVGLAYFLVWSLLTSAFLTRRPSPTPE